MFTLVVGHRNCAFYKKSTWKTFTLVTKYELKTSFPCESLIKALTNANNGSKQNKVNNVRISQRISNFNFA